eukprot:1098557-Prymnesium_polylepis.1
MASETVQATPTQPVRPQRRAAGVCYAETSSKQSKFPGKPDDAIVLLATRGGTQAQAARAAECCPVALN